MTSISELPFDEIWLHDFEFVAQPGERPDVVCLAAREMRSGRTIRLWRDELGTQPPYRTDDRVLCLALALVLDGVDRKTAAETCGMDRQTLRDWVHRYNAAGLAGLRNLKSPGPGSKLTVRQQAELAELSAGPDPAVHGVVRWRRVDLRDELQRRFGVALHERSVGRF